MIACACSRFDLIVGSAEADPTASSSPAASAATSTIFGVHPVVEPPQWTPRRLRTDPPVAVWPVTSRGA